MGFRGFPGFTFTQATTNSQPQGPRFAWKQSPPKDCVLAVVDGSSPTFWTVEELLSLPRRVADIKVKSANGEEIYVVKTGRTIIAEDT